ncbi:hypothetical protein BDV37DRAFT_294057 [Aspergillus pseudonomiae]|uniref:Uncharacterized protein n=1 Tax=Aspergillus pseudonomiae TaxID=1506151 RepID=A0A5N7DDZ7_9EURO|nr:uncharacterized protein BDV37DRAFT_294057 [Aspergillus pseudonomiae]KAE8404415.1 hypothetical protein BDV37DRAFT_294057 [Aspergillus pseudonomiae]
MSTNGICIFAAYYWGAWPARKVNKRKGLIVPAAELEQLDLETDLPMWSCFYRTILDDPKIGRLSISGISPHLMMDRKKHRVIIDADNALVFPGPKMAYQRWNIGFRMANLFETDWNREKGLHIGYVMHPHCWLLVDRFLGHSVHNCPRYGAGNFNRTHMSSSPFIIRDIQTLITVATNEHGKPLGQGARWRSIVANVPVKVIMIIIDTIYERRPPCPERIQDTRNVLEAFQWKIPDSYWHRRCNPSLVFEVQDAIKAGTQIDWVYFFLGLHELLLQEDWYCNSGLYFRGRILYLVECIEGCISNGT